MITRVIAAFLDSGFLKAGTPSAIASIPVSAVQPAAKARGPRLQSPGSPDWGDCTLATGDCGGGPADFAMDCAGAVAVLQQAASSVGMRGTVALIGGAPAGASFSLDHMSTLWGKRVVGILGGEGRSASLIGALIALNKQGRFPYDKLITSFPLHQVNDALEASRAGDVIKPVLRMPE